MDTKEKIILISVIVIFISIFAFLFVRAETKYNVVELTFSDGTVKVARLTKADYTLYFSSNQVKFMQVPGEDFKRSIASVIKLKDLNKE